MKELWDMNLHNTHMEKKRELEGRAWDEVTATSMKQKLKSPCPLPPEKNLHPHAQMLSSIKLLNDISSDTPHAHSS